jgi:hypothetical protein
MEEGIREGSNNPRREVGLCRLCFLIQERDCWVWSEMGLSKLFEASIKYTPSSGT